MNFPTFSSDDAQEVALWRQKIEVANQNNILCYCRDCQEEWVTSDPKTPCICGSHNIQRILCWQFPDD